MCIFGFETEKWVYASEMKNNAAEKYEQRSLLKKN